MRNWWMVFEVILSKLYFDDPWRVSFHPADPAVLIIVFPSWKVLYLEIKPDFLVFSMMQK